jgi:hypothetical protein
MNCKGCLLSGIAFLLVGLLALGVFTITVGHFLTAVDAFSEADAIVVLGGDSGNFFRVRQGVALFNEGCAPVVVFSGGISLKDAGLACSSAQLSLEAAQELGLPADATLIASGSQSTYNEAVNLRRLAQQHHWHSLIIYHRHRLIPHPSSHSHLSHALAGYDHLRQRRRRSELRPRPLVADGGRVDRRVQRGDQAGFLLGQVWDHTLWMMEEGRGSKGAGERGRQSEGEKGRQGKRAGVEMSVS